MSARDKLVDFLVQYGGRCRDCADENGFCPQTGIGCGQRRKAAEFILGAIEYGSKHGFTPGYVILSPDEVRGIRDEALDDAIKAALDHPGQQFTNHRGQVDWAPSSKYDVAAAIRSLKGGRDAQ